MRSHIVVCLAVAAGFALGMAAEAMRVSASNSDTAHVTGIGGVFFKAHEPQKLAEWYKQHLGVGFQSGGNSPNAPAFSPFEWTEKDGGKPGATIFAIFSEKSKYFDPSNAPFMINFRVTDLDRLLAQLKQDGVTVDAKTENAPNGKFGWAMDPEGNRIELWEPNGK